MTERDRGQPWNGGGARRGRHFLAGQSGAYMVQLMRKKGFGRQGTAKTEGTRMHHADIE